MTQRSTGGNTNQRARPCSVPLPVLWGPVGPVKFGGQLDTRARGLLLLAGRLAEPATPADDPVNSLRQREMGKEHMCRKMMVYMRTRVRAPQFKEARCVQVVKACGNIVVDWYALDVGQGELTFAQLYEGLVAASMMKASGEQGQQEWMFPARYAGTGSTQQCSNNNTVAQYYYSARLKSGVMTTMLPLVCWNCGEEETLPILAEKTQLHTRQ
ncbi:hypothetical protein Bbelb_066190 [Branchiostoma belcheri]|nr:hypothetical protein Bbelb_066190 [Branchiostoma belcheri]